MILNIKTKFDVGDVVLYEVQRWGNSYHKRIEVRITGVFVRFLEHTTTIIYDCESTEKDDTFSRYPKHTFINCYNETLEKYFTKGEQDVHPIDIEYDYVYNFGDRVLQIVNGTPYGIYPPNPFCVRGFSFEKREERFVDRTKNYNKELYSVFGYNPMDNESHWDVQCSWNSRIDTIISKLPDDYFDKLWGKLRYTKPFKTNENERDTNFEVLFKYLGILDKAKQSYDDYLNKKRKERDKTVTKKLTVKKKDNTKIDEILDCLTEKEKKELLKKLQTGK